MRRRHRKAWHRQPVRPRRRHCDELQADIKKIKLPKGFKIEVYASGLPEARQMAWGANGTLFVGSFNATNVYAVTDQDGKRTVKTILKGLEHADRGRFS